MMQFHEWVLSNCGPPSRFLAFGDMFEVHNALEQADWEGLLIQGLYSLRALRQWRPQRVQRILGQMGPDPHFVPCMDEGALIKAITVEDIYSQFLYGKDWPVVILWTEDQNRMLWSGLKDRLDNGPLLWIMPEDGHNEEVVAWATEKGYTPEVKQWGQRSVLTLRRQ